MGLRPPSPRRERCAALAVLALVASFAVTHAAIAGLTWRSLRNEWALDLAYFHQQVWNLAHGRGFAQSLHWHESQSLFGNTHFNPIIALAAPLQWLWPGLDSLLALQSLLIAAAGWGAWRLARAHGASPETGLAAATVFLLQAPLWRLAQADVRPLLWSIPFLVLLAAALAERRHREALLWALVACMCREELPIIVAGIAVLHGFGRVSPRRRGLAVQIALGALGLWLATSLIRPESEAYIDPSMWVMESLGWVLDLPRGVGGDPEWLGRLPGRLLWLAGWAWPVGVLALGAPRLLLAAVPLFAYLMTTNVGWASWSGEGPHYTAPAVALVGAAAAVALGRLDASEATGPHPWSGPARGPGPRPRWLLVAVVGAVLLIEGAQLRSAASGWIADDVRTAWNREPSIVVLQTLVDQVPPDASVIADFDTVHLFAGRQHLICYERLAMRPGVDPGSAGPLPGVTEPPTWGLLKEQHAPWIAWAERRGMAERGRTGNYVLFGPLTW